MTWQWRAPRHRGALAPFLLALLLSLTACGGAASPTIGPTVAPAAAVATAGATATTTRGAVTPIAASATVATPMLATRVAVAPTGAAPTVGEGAATVGAPSPTVAAAPRVGQPVRLQIPAIRVDAAIEQVGLTANGDMDTPKDYDNTGWYTPGSRPGDPGNAVIAGHVDSKTDIAVFWYLRDLRPGDEIVVVGDDGIARRFVVTLTEAYVRAAAPLTRIFGPTSGAHLNLITCAGDFDRKKGAYDKNLVVYADYVP